MPDRMEKSPCHNMYINLDEGTLSQPNIKKYIQKKLSGGRCPPVRATSATLFQDDTRDFKITKV